MKNVSNDLRIIVTMTTIPSGLKGLEEVLTCLLNQRYRQADKIYINLPFVFVRTGEKYPEDEIYILYEKIQTSKVNPHGVIVEITRPEDKGAITKIYPVLDLPEEKDPNTVIVACDDDYLIADNMIEVVERWIKEYPNACLTTGGWIRGNLFSNGIPMYQALSFEKEEVRKVDWIEGSKLMIIPRKFLAENSRELLDYSSVEEDDIRKLLMKHDDHWISWHLKNNHAELLSIPETLILDKVKNDKDYHISGVKGNSNKNSNSKNITASNDSNLSYGEQLTKKLQGTGFLKFCREVDTVSSYLHSKGVYKEKATMYPIPMTMRCGLPALFCIIILIIIIIVIVNKRKSTK